MSLKAVLFDFNGVIINDEAIHRESIEQLLLEQNLQPKAEEYRQDCLGRSDRACLQKLFERRGYLLDSAELNRMLQRKALAYRDRIAQLDRLPIYPDAQQAIFDLRVARLPLAIVSGSTASDIEAVLERANLRQSFQVVVSDERVRAGKPEPEGYLLAAAELGARPEECLAIEDSFAGITAAKRAGIQVVGVAHTYPFHMLQRLANWTVDRLTDLELDRIVRSFEPEGPHPTEAG